jgi:hypothetical protein
MLVAPSSSRGACIIVRIWHGRTPRGVAAEYAAFLARHAIRAFAGDAQLRSKFYPEDTGYLLEFEPEVQQYTVVARAP